MSKDTESQSALTHGSRVSFEELGQNSKSTARCLKAKQLLIICIIAAVVGLSCLVAVHCLNRTPAKMYISLEINSSSIARCRQGVNLSLAAQQLPCITSNNLMMTSGRPLAPLVCADNDRANCDRNRFELTRDRDGVVIPENGVYRVHSRVTFLDGDSTAYLTSTVRVDGGGGGGGGAGSDGSRGIWLDCASHSAHVGAEEPFGACALDGIRRMRRGDVVSFQVGSAGRLVNTHGPATRFFLYKL